MVEQDIFQELGLTLNEGKVYSELIKFDKLPAAEVSSKSGVPYGKIYVVLQALIDKGLVRIIPDKTKKYSCASPDNFEKLISKKKKILEDASVKLKELKKFYDSKEKDFLVVSEGDKGFWKISHDMIDFREYAYNIKWNTQLNPGFLAWMRKKLKKKNLDLKNLVRYDSDTKKNVDKVARIAFPQRKIDNDGVAMSILDDKEVMIGLIKKNTTLLIRDEAFAKIMKDLFNAKYNVAEKIS